MTKLRLKKLKIASHLFVITGLLLLINEPSGIDSRFNISPENIIIGSGSKYNSKHDYTKPAYYAELSFLPRKKSHAVRLAELVQEQNIKREKQKQRLISFLESHYLIDHQHAQKLVKYAAYNAHKYDFDTELILAMIAVESTYNRTARSKAGAIGLMQIIPKWHLDKISTFGGVDVLVNIPTNIAIGTQILYEYLEKDQGNLTQALLRYNGSRKDESQTYAKKVLKEYERLKTVSLTPRYTVSFTSQKIASLDNHPVIQTLSSRAMTRL